MNCGYYDPKNNAQIFRDDLRGCGKNVTNAIETLEIED